MTPVPHSEIVDGLHRFEDTCNVYLLRGPEGCIAVDFGSGRWLDRVSDLGLPPVRHVFLTHHHADQCRGLQDRDAWPFTIHAPAGEDKFLQPQLIEQFWSSRAGGGVPATYSAIDHGVAGVVYDMAGASDGFWGARRLRYLHTPGHGCNAMTVLLDHDGGQIAFCGDAVHARGTIWQPYCLEWDHWTGSGALAAWEGIERLRGVRIDLLCPSHGPVITNNIPATLAKLGERLLELYRVKGSICTGEPDRYIEPSFLACGARRILPHLIQFGANSYLLLSHCGTALVVDPYLGDLDRLEPLLEEVRRPAVTAATATHYHLDHSDGLSKLRRDHGGQVWLHPAVAQPLKEIGTFDVPWLPAEPILPDALLPETGAWKWNEYEFQVDHLPGQTWWHCGLMATVDGRKVLFSGDSFQPASRWNGTGGFCSMNGSRFREGFVATARRIIHWQPDIVAAGHGTYTRYSESYFRKVIAWAERAEAAVTALCPSGNLQKDYYLAPTGRSA